MKPVEGLVTIVLPVYNNEETLVSCLESILSQTYPLWEVIAIDDHSKDKSFQLLKQFKKRDPRIKVFRNVKHYGLAITFNRALTKAKGQYIAFMSGSDVSTIDRIKRQVSLFNANPKLVAAGTQCVFQDENGKIKAKSDFPLLHEEIIHSPINGVTMQFETTMINRFRVPKDLLKFSHTEKGLLFSDLFVKLQQYGIFANTNVYLYKQIQTSKAAFSSMKHSFASHLSLLIRAKFAHNYTISLDSIVSPFVKA